MEKHTFNITNISCGHCVAAIEKELIKIGGIANVKDDLQAKTVAVEWQSPASKSQIEAKLAEIGYPATI